MLKPANDRGDTLVEVMLAVVILSIVTLGGLAIMNKGIGFSLGVLERTEVRSRINQQLEILTYVRDQYAASTLDQNGAMTYPAGLLWEDIRDNRVNALGSPNTTDPASCTPNSGSFYFREKADQTYELVATTRGMPQSNPSPTAGDGLWIEAVASPNDPNSIGYIDFYIKSCWEAIVGGENATLSTAVRLYDQ